MRTIELKHLAEAAQAAGPDSAAGKAFQQAVTPDAILALIAESEGHHTTAADRHSSFLKLGGALAKLAQENGYEVGRGIEGRLAWVRQFIADSQQEHDELIAMRRFSRIWKSPAELAPIDTPVLVLRDAGAVGNSRHPGFGSGAWIEISKRAGISADLSKDTNMFMCDLMSTGNTLGWAPLSRFQDLEALLAGVVPPEGWHLLPSEPTPELLAVLGGDEDGPPIHVSLARRSYRELLTKAPKPALVEVDGLPPLDAEIRAEP